MKTKTQPNGSSAVVWLSFWFSTRFTRKILDYSNGTCLYFIQCKKNFRAIGKACLKSAPSEAENRVGVGENDEPIDGFVLGNFTVGET